MDPLIERFERILRSFINTENQPHDWEDVSEERDFQDAQAELDEFLHGGSEAKPGRSSGSNDSASRKANHASYRFRMPPESLRKDYRRLQVAFGASYSEVRISYRNLMREHHPDLHSADQEQQRNATRRAQDLNVSFQRIKAWELAKQES